MKVFKSFIVFLAILSTSYAFELVTVEPKATVIPYGGKLRLTCNADGHYEWCKFIHNDKICDFQWKRDVWNITTLECSDFEGRSRFVGTYDSYECGMELENVTPEDAGEWQCELESYHAGRYRGYGYKKTGVMEISVPTTTTTNTTTTTTTTTKDITTKGETKATSSEFESTQGSGNDPQRDDGNCEDDVNSGDYCRNHSWACKDSRYPWFKTLYCRRTCGSCNEKVR